MEVDSSAVSSTVRSKKRSLSEMDASSALDAETSGESPPRKFAKVVVPKPPATNPLAMLARPSVSLEKVRKQIEYYFSDGNLPTDQFMLDLIAETGDGWFPVDRLSSFKKLGRMTEELSVITEAIRGSKCLQLSEDCSGVKRNASVLGELPDRSTLKNVTLFAKGFHPRNTRTDIESFFRRQYGEESVVSVNLIRADTIIGDTDDAVAKLFNGDAFVQLKDIETMKKWCGLTLEWKGRQIVTGPSFLYWKTQRVAVESEALPFESDVTLHISNVPQFATASDVRVWLSVQSKGAQDFMRFKAAYVWKESGGSTGYIRLSSGKSAKAAAKVLSKRPLMSTAIRVIALDDEDSKRIWPKIAVPLAAAKKVTLMTKRDCDSVMVPKSALFSDDYILKGR